MKAFIISGKQKVEFISVNIKPPGKEELLITVKTIGLCGSDLKSYNNENPMVKYPIIPGHEIGGVVVAKGSDVPDSIRIGDKGTVFPYTYCGVCPACKLGRFNTCAENRTMGVARDGAATEQILIRYKDFISCPELDFSEIALIEPLSVGRHAAMRAGDVRGKNVLIYGLGIVGVGVLLELKKQGAHVIVADISEKKLELAKSIGAEHIINLNDSDYSDQLDAFKSSGISAIFDAVGAAAIVSAAIENCSVAGIVVLIGYYNDMHPFNSKLIVSKELTVSGARNALKSDMESVRDLLLQNKRLKDLLITKCFDYKKIEQAFRYWNKKKSSVRKIIIEMN
ncbi:MAG: alcohol dehydrogenase catalytic domain-containing protein [Spirochaetales bacterium]|uniref:Alcohol dehydrogenase catalytic domain-containing protein n=1 Tax=Candidatus Thalassospirochaeta sargassi TaxID=3119039 RepID=A0AAJ1IC93_9SPIO|nr:alcohol dehydrogenase catalytic domain-containing protein [Spirochaetales bacterium]